MASDDCDKVTKRENGENGGASGERCTEDGAGVVGDSKSGSSLYELSDNSSPYTSKGTPWVFYNHILGKVQDIGCK